MWIRWFWFLLANKDASSLWRVNPSCKTVRNCVEIHNMNLQRNWGGRTLAVKAEQKCVHIFGNKGRSGMWNYRSFAVKAEGKCRGGTSHIGNEVGRAEADLNIFDRPISYWLSLPKLKNNSTDCYIEGQCEDHVWLKHMTFAMRVTMSVCSCKGSG